MATLSSNQVPTLFRDENYKAFLTTLPLQCDELEKQGFFALFGKDEIAAYSSFKTHVFGSYNDETARNPGEPLPPRTMAQGYNYWTAVRAEFTESTSIPNEYLESTLKLGDYGALQGEITASNYYQSWATYWTDMLAFGAIASATLAATGNGSPGRHPRSRIYAHYLKGEQGSIIAQIPKQDTGSPDGLPWFSFANAPHARANGDTIADYAGKLLGFFNAGNRNSENMRLSENNLVNTLLHIENDLSWGPDRRFYSAAMPETLVCSGNLRAVAASIIDINEYRQDSPNNDKNLMFRGSKVFGIKNIVVNRFLPDNCWYLAAKGKGLDVVYKKGRPGPVGVDGPVKSSISNVYCDVTTHIWVQQFLAYWSHQFDENMDICWYAGSTPLTISGGRPVAPTEASLKDW